MKLWKKILFGAAFAGAGYCGYADASHIPAWWFEHGVVTDTSEHEASDEAREENYSVANVGQLMYIAAKAKEELNEKHPGTSNAANAINDLVALFILNNTVNQNNPNQDFDIDDNYEILNIGQLKHVTSLFYNRLWELPPGIVTWPKGMTFTGGEGKYPWPDLPASSDPNYESAMEDNYMAANIGQVKYLFSWSLKAEVDPNDTDGDGIDDWWEYKHFGNLSTADGTSCYNGDGTSDLEKFLNGIDPTLPPANSNLKLILYTPLEI